MEEGQQRKWKGKMRSEEEETKGGVKEEGGGERASEGR